MDLHHGNHFARDFLADDGMAEVCIGFAHLMLSITSHDSSSLVLQLVLCLRRWHCMLETAQVLKLLHHHDEYVAREAFLLADALIQQVLSGV